MGLNPFWQNDFLTTMQNLHQHTQVNESEPYLIMQLSDAVFVHLIPLRNKFSGSALVELQERYQENHRQLIHLWEDVWAMRRLQVINRLHSFLGLNTGIHGRKCKLAEISTTEATAFFSEYHLQGAVKAEQTYGLIYNQELIAAASFSKSRPMKSKGPTYRSAELVRFASKANYTVVGGLSKLIKHFVNEVSVNDIMTYADRDWSLGSGYERLKFSLTSATPPSDLYVECETLIRYFPHRLPKATIKAFENQEIFNFDEYLASQGFVKVFNTGNLKYHLYL